MAVKKPQLPKGLLEYSEDELAKKLIEWTQLEAKGLQSFIHDLLQTVNIPVVTSAPVEEVDYPPILKLMDDGGGNRRLYVYYEGAWSYIELVGGGGAPSSDAFGVIAVSGETSIEADTGSDTLTIIEGTDITMTTDHVSDELTIGLSAGVMTHNHDDRYYTEAEVDAELDIIDGQLAFFNGTFLESFNALVTSDGATVTMSIEKSGTGDLTMVFSSGQSTLDCTPAATIALTAGTDASPQENYIYIPESTGVLTKSTTEWPAAEHIKVGYFLCPSATLAQSDGLYINQNWNDHRTGTDEQGHLAHLCEAIRLTMDGANWHSGVGPNGDGGTWIAITGTPDEVYFKSTAGVAFQMHKHTVPAWDMSGTDNCHVVNWNADAYHLITDLASIVADSTGTSLNNKYYNLVFWGTANKTGEYSPLMCNLPNGSYVRLDDAIVDINGYDVTTIPSEFTKESTIGFLICRLTFKMAGTTFTLESTQDLRGVAAGASGGSGGTLGFVTEFADNVFNIYDSDDITRVLDFDLAGITTGNTRTITPADADMTLLSTTDYNDLTDAGATTLHKHDHGGMDGLLDNDHTQYILHSLATAASDFLVASGSGTFVKKTLAETGAILEADIQHDNLQSIPAEDHITHSGVSITAGAGLTGGGTISATRDIAVGAGTGITVNANDVATNDGEIVHANLSGYDANDHIDHTTVSVIAGTLLTGGGTIAADRTLNVDEASIDHGSIAGLTDDDHTQYTKHALATAANDFLVASGSGAFVKKTLAETIAILAHTATHERGGADAIDGDHLDITYTPTNYTPSTTPAEAAHVDDLAAHLYGIDTQLAAAGGGGFPTGTKMWFYQAAAPTDWTVDNTLGDKVLAVHGTSAYASSTGGGQQQGSFTYTGITTANDTHNHKYYDYISGTNTKNISDSTANTCYTWQSNGTSVQQWAGYGVDHYTINDTHNHTVSHDGTDRPAANVGIICTKD
jgi:hypothetical protein